MLEELTAFSSASPPYLP